VIPPKATFATDSPLEEDGFELPVPPLRRGVFLNRLLPPLQLAKLVETEIFDPRGTGGSNPSSSSGESEANLLSGIVRKIVGQPLGRLGEKAGTHDNMQHGVAARVSNHFD
jgi:hypothetical protein